MFVPTAAHSPRQTSLFGLRSVAVVSALFVCGISQRLVAQQPTIQDVKAAGQTASVAAESPQGMVGSAGPVDAARPYSYVFLDPLEGQHKPVGNSGNHVGVEMHGHWVIDVKNPDGTLAEHRDFENTIQTGGQELLVSLLAGYSVPSDYGLLVGPSSNSLPPPCALVGNTSACGIVRSTVTMPGSVICAFYTCFTSLTYLPTISDSGGADSFTLAGNFTASQAGSISTVSVEYGTCPTSPAGTGLTTISPSTCSTTTGSGGFRSLSSASITTVNIVASQIVQITVTITFS